MYLSFACSHEDPVAKQYKDYIQAENDAKGKRSITFAQAIDSQQLGLAPNPNIDGKSLLEIVSSQKPGRDDGRLCSSCHNKSVALGGYWVPSEADEALTQLDPTNPVAGRAWTGADGWAVRFVNNASKPRNVQVIIQAWIEGGFELR